MPIEPHQVTTVSRRPITASDKPRTYADYQDDMIRRFGKVPSWTELAKRENQAAWGARRRDETTYQQRDDVRELYRIAAVRRGQKQSDASDREVMAALVDGDSFCAMQRRIGKSVNLIRPALCRLQEKGLVFRKGVGANGRWFHAQEAAE